MTRTDTDQAVLASIKEYWGFEQLRPLQAEAIAAGVQRRDSLVVMPTGGGKSLCYQVPPLIAKRTDVVVSPLIARMKDQVDGLRACGYPAAAIHSGMSREEQSEISADLYNGRLRLLFVSPERILTPGFLRLMEGAKVQAFAIDEAHCISHWGHDFRPEYRRLAELKKHFPKATLHAFTATATGRVQQDIVKQLRLTDAQELVGSFDRPNLVYRVIPRSDVDAQVIDILSRHKRQAAIVYCISRKDTEARAGALKKVGIRAAYYHAGMDATSRRETQDAFARERLDVIVATVAFGMGIDRSDVRCVIHAAMPKSVEHYQQESGRAGRDGLEAECVLLYSPADAMKWEGLIRRSSEEAGVESATTEAILSLLKHMRTYAGGMACRHSALVEYFGQSLEKDNCGACDVCLNEIEDLEDVTVLAQKVLSCVARVGECFGVVHIVDILKGAKTERMLHNRHHQLSTYGLLSDMDKAALKRRVFDLVDQGILARTTDEMPVLRLNNVSWEVLRGERRVSLRKQEVRVVRKTRAESDSWEGVDQGLFDVLRALRLELANERDAPAYTIMHDTTLRDIARRRPVTLMQFREAHGIGDAKAAAFGERTTKCVRQYCEQHGLDTNQSTPSGMPLPAHAKPPQAGPAPRKPASTSPAKKRALQMFADGADIDEVTEAVQRGRSTTCGYLAEYIIENRPESLERWVDIDTYQRVRPLLEQHGTRFLRPTFEKLDGHVPFETIRLVAAHMTANDPA